MRERLAAMSVFAQVVESRSFSAAAQKLGLSKSLVSRQVSALERELAVRLLNRSTRRLSLTEAGTVFHEHCVRIVREADYAEQRVTQTQAELVGQVRLTCVQPFAVRHVVPALVEFQRRNPGIRVRLSCTNRRLDLGDERFDLGIRMSLKLDPELVARRLAANRGVVCAAPSYLAQRGTPLAIGELGTHDAVHFTPLAPRGNWTLQRDGERFNVAMSSRFESDDPVVVHEAALAGLGIGVLPAYVAADDLRHGRLVPLLREFQLLPEGSIHLVYLPNRTLPRRVRALIDFLLERFAVAPPWEDGW
jgi:DNA-binding transcriptional LysR family regulator